MTLLEWLRTELEKADDATSWTHLISYNYS